MSGGELDILSLHLIYVFLYPAGPHSTLIALDPVYLDAAVCVGAGEVDVAALLPGTPAHLLSGGERPTGLLVW